MARLNEQLIDVPLEGGIVHSLDPYRVGPRVRDQANLVANRTRQMLTTMEGPVGPITPTSDAVELNGCGQRGGDAVLLGVDGSGFFKAWSASTGVKFTGGTNRVCSDVDDYTAAYAYWPLTGFGYASHFGINGIYTLNGLGAWSNYAPANAPPGATALIVHLDRLWMADHVGSVDDTQVWYTDPLVDSSIQPTSFINIPDAVGTMFRPNIGDIDASALGHLAFGCRDSIWVLDGDPTQGNAVRRQLTRGIGISASANVVETPFGAIFLGTDVQVYLMPAGAIEITPMGGPIRDRLSFGFDTQRYGGPPATLIWSDPYVLCCMPTIDEMFTLDFSDPSTPRWSGPHTYPQVTTVHGACRVESRFIPPTIFVAERFGVGAAKPASFAIGQGFTGQTQRIKTGYFIKPGFEVSPSRVVLMLTAQDASYPVTVIATAPDGETNVVTEDVPAGTFSGFEHVITHVVTFPPPRIRGDFFSIEVQSAVGGILPIRRMMVGMTATERRY